MYCEKCRTVHSKQLYIYCIVNKNLFSTFCRRCLLFITWYKVTSTKCTKVCLKAVLTVCLLYLVLVQLLRKLKSLMRVNPAVVVVCFSLLQGSLEERNSLMVG